MTPPLDPNDPMFKPLTMREVLEITGRSRRTIEKWVKNGRLTKYERRNARDVVIGRVFNEAQVVETESERAAAARENRDRIRRRARLQRPQLPPEGARLDENPPGDASLP